MFLCPLATVTAAQARAPMYLHIETSTGNDTLMAGVPGSIIFRADSSEGWYANGMAWPIQYRFSNGNIIGPLSEGAEVIYSARSLAVFEIRAWQAEETGWRVYQVLFSRSGFTQPVRQRADNDPDLLLFGPEDMI